MDNGILLRETRSVCPECGKTIPARIVESNGKVLMRKHCDEHGDFEDIYWGSAKTYKEYMEWFYTGEGVSNPNTESTGSCPHDCGLCSNHKSQTILSIIDVTNRCNFNCPICFANANKAGYVYEPSKEQIEKMLDMLASQKPSRNWVVMFSGGEPTVRDDLPELIRMARSKGFFVLIATNGKRMAEDKAFCKEVVDAGLDIAYLQFDGITPEPYIVARGFNAFPLKLKLLQNFREIGFKGTVLVPTVVKGVNDGQVGGIIKFAFDNIDVVRGVNFQPVSFAGRIDTSKLKERRITIPDLIDRISEQTNGEVSQDDFYPIPATVPLSKFLMGKGLPWELSAHPMCGASSYLIKTKGGKLASVPQLIDIKKLMGLLKEANGGKISRMKLAMRLPGVMKPGSMKLGGAQLLNWLGGVLAGKEKADTFQTPNMLFIGTMHFQDKYNLDLERTERCIVHYATPDGRIIPFCTYNNFHRGELEKKFSRPLKV